MSILPQKRPAEETESIKRFRQTEPNSPENSDPIGDCIGEGIGEGSSDDEDCFEYGEELKSFCYDSALADDKPRKPLYCFRCKGTDHVPAFCKLSPYYAICAEDRNSKTEDYCTVCDKVTDHDTFNCPHRCMFCFNKPHSGGH